MSASKIEWTDATWNPVRGCTRVSDGCRNCYAERQTARFPYGQPYASMTPSGPRWTGKVELIESKLREPLSWRKPRRVFVNSMSDLFHEALSDDAIARVFAVMAHAPAHTFQVLTKRPERMQRWVAERPGSLAGSVPGNVWLGVSVEDQATADARIPVLLDTPAAVRFVSYEPALGPVDFEPAWLSTDLSCPVCDEAECDHRSLDWLIVGGESGPGARPCDVAWIRSAVEQCRAARVSCFVKQLGSYPRLAPDDEWPKLRDAKGGDPSEWPEDLRVREFPA